MICNDLVILADKGLTFQNPVGTNVEIGRWVPFELKVEITRQEQTMLAAESRLLNKDYADEIAHRMLKAKRFIDDNYYEQLTMDEVSRVSCTSKFHMIRCFKKIFSCTPYNYLINKRLSAAVYLMNTMHVSIEQIALIVGFQQRKSFSLAFKKRFNISPTEYRELYFLNNSA